MKKIRFTILYLLKSFQRYKGVVTLIFLAALLIIAIGARAHEHLFKQTITEGVIGTYTQDNLPPAVLNLVSQGLIKLDSAGQPQPNLVTGWKTNAAATEYTFTLKPNLKWSDGTPVKAEDIEVPFEDAKELTPNDKTIVFKLNDSFSPFPTLLTRPIIKKGTRVGIGPYTINSIQTPKVFVEKIALVSSDASLPNLTLRFYPNERIAEDALKIGEVESVLGVNELSDFQGSPPFEVIQKPNHSRVVTIFYNNNDPVLSDKNFRLALSFAAPSIKGEETAVTSLPQTSWAFNPDVRDYLDNDTEAKTYLAKVKDENSVITLTSTSSLKSVGERVVEQWKKMGIKAVLKVESGVPQNFQALLIAQDIPLDPDQYSLWHSTQTQTNVSHYSSKRVDKDLEDGRKIVDQKTRKENYQDFQKVLLDDAPATFLYFPRINIVAMRKIDPFLQKVIKLQLANTSI